MSFQNLSTICPDKLFEECSISEIKAIQVKLKIEVEKKREELRTMVGERYRDLIEAADTISTMKTNAEKIISHIENISAKCLELQEKNLLGFKLDADTSATERLTGRKPYIMMAVQIKILMDIPEQIWAAIDEEDYLLAAQLYLLARHINTCLQYSSGDEYINSNKVLKWFPVLTRQWNTVALFRNTILSGCREKLKLIDLTIETASSCIATDLLLEGCSLALSEQMFLNLRMESLQQILVYDSQISIKEQICQSLKLLAQTLYFRHACFIEDSDESIYPGNLVSKILLAIVSDEASKSITLLKIQNESFGKFIPSIIQQFRPTWSSEPAYNSKGSTDHILGPWLNSVKVFLQKTLLGLLKFVASIKGLYAIREGAWEVLNDSKNKLPQSAVEVGVGDGGLWEGLFRPIVTNRVLDLVSISLDRALDEMKSDLQEAASAANGSRSGANNNSEHNLYWYIWKEWPHDLQILDTSNDAGDNESNINGWMLTTARSQKTPGGLEMKAKGYSPLVQKLCQNFDSHLEALLEDFLWYICDKDHSNSRMVSLYPFNKFIDKAELKQHLQTKTLESIKNLIEYVKNDMLAKFSELGDNANNEASAVLVGRFLMGLTELCPQLQKCMCPTSIGDTKAGSYGASFARTGSESNSWIEACRLLNDLSIDLLRIWRRAARQRIQAIVKISLTVPPSSVSLLSCIPAWDQVTIEEGSDEGQSIRSTIRVPCFPSFPLHTVLFATCQEINMLTPHTLPRKIHQELVEDLAESLLENYGPLCNLESIPQVQALQFLFDVEYITILFLGRENKTLLEQAHRICDKMKTFIDPFDYDVFSPYIHKNIKASVRRTQTLLGVALSQDKVQSLTRTSSQVNESMAEPNDPSIMPLCSPNVHAFPLLPLSHSGNLPRRSPGAEKVNLVPQVDKQVKKVSKISQGQLTSQQPKKGSSDQSTSGGLIARSGAFFGAMGSDWF